MPGSLCTGARPARDCREPAMLICTYQQLPSFPNIKPYIFLTAFWVKQLLQNYGLNCKILSKFPLHCICNVYMDLQGVYREIRMRGFQIFGDCLLPKISVILKSPHPHFYCNICGEFYVTMGKPCVIMKYEIKLYREISVKV